MCGSSRAVKISSFSSKLDRGERIGRDVLIINTSYIAGKCVLIMRSTEEEHWLRLLLPGAIPVYIRRSSPLSLGCPLTILLMAFNSHIYAPRHLLLFSFLRARVRFMCRNNGVKSLIYSLGSLKLPSRDYPSKNHKNN